MTVEYVNRRGDKYLLQAGSTKTGKPKYWFGRKLTGVPVNSVPDGFEIRENPENALVSLRKSVRSSVSQFERESLGRAIRELAGLEYFFIELEKDSLVVFLPDRDPRAVKHLMTRMMGDMCGGGGDFESWSAGHTRYDKMMRFSLVDEDDRLFTVERWCFRGSVDRWIHICGPDALDSQIKKFVPHLGQESFFDLM